MSEPLDEAIRSYVRHRRVGGELPIVLQAHTASDCPDREHCWAADIHDRYSPRAVVSSLPAKEQTQ